MDNETRRMLRAAFRAGYRFGWADLNNGYPHEPNGPADRFVARVEADGEVGFGPDDLCLRCGDPLGERVPAYVFVNHGTGPARQKGVRVCFDCAARHTNVFTRSEFYELMEVRDASD